MAAVLSARRRRSYRSIFGVAWFCAEDETRPSSSWMGEHSRRTQLVNMGARPGRPREERGERCGKGGLLRHLRRPVPRRLDRNRL